jgi:ABC-type cobalamin transport system ATPase subunit
MRTHTSKQFMYIGKLAKGGTSTNALHVLTLKLKLTMRVQTCLQKESTASETQKVQVCNVVLQIMVHTYPIS